MEKDKEFKTFVAIRIIVGLVLTIGILWGLTIVLGFFGKPPEDTSITHSPTKQTQDTHGEDTQVKPTAKTDHEPKAAPKTDDTHSNPQTKDTHSAPAKEHGTDAQVPAAVAVDKNKGVLFVEACIEPLKYELKERFWGWRVNDLLQFTDNVNNYQRGVLEVTRRVTVVLAERISRTGSASAFDENLESAMNWFMVNGEQYWFPSAESKYKEGLDELEKYKQKLERGTAAFHSRADNLLPILRVFEDLLGSCDENLVKTHDENGKPVTSSGADDYIYYAKGAAKAMGMILEAVHHDFHDLLQGGGYTEPLHHAIVMCQVAANLEPFIVLESSYNSIFANHRANMAGPISHARFYLQVLIKSITLLNQ